MYLKKISEKLDKKLLKISKKNKKIIYILDEKMNEIIENPFRYKRLHKAKKGLFRVHIDRSFVLVFLIDEINKSVLFLDFDHHDKIYF